MFKSEGRGRTHLDSEGLRIGLINGGSFERKVGRCEFLVVGDRGERRWVGDVIDEQKPVEVVELVL